MNTNIGWDAVLLLDNGTLIEKDTAAIGRVCNDKKGRFTDGTQIITGPVISIETLLNNRLYIIKTKNSSYLAVAE